MSAFNEYFTSLLTKLRDCSFISDESNVVFGECLDVLRLEDSSFPRLEVLVIKLKNDGYVSQRQVRWVIRYAIAGYLKVDNSSEYLSIEEIGRATDFAKEVVDLNYDLLNDKQQGRSPCTGFEKMGEFPEIFIEKELIPNTVCFIADLEAHILISDTEVL